MSAGLLFGLEAAIWEKVAFNAALNGSAASAFREP
jgi:hypothetical protein